MLIIIHIEIFMNYVILMIFNYESKPKINIQKKIIISLLFIYFYCNHITCDLLLAGQCLHPRDLLR